MASESDSDFRESDLDPEEEEDVLEGEEEDEDDEDDDMTEAEQLIATVRHWMAVAEQAEAEGDEEALGEAQQEAQGAFLMYQMLLGGARRRQAAAAPAPRVRDTSAEANRSDLERAQLEGLSGTQFASRVRAQALRRCNATALVVERVRRGRLTPRRAAGLAPVCLPEARGSRGLRTGGRVYSGQFTRDGSLYVTAGQDHQIAVINADSWKLHKSIAPRDVHWTVTSVDASPDQRFIAYSSIHPVVHLCNLHGDYEIHDRLDFAGDGGAEFGLWCVRFSAGGGEMIGGTSVSRLAVYDIERKTPTHLVPAHSDDINAIAYAGSQYRSHLIVTGSDDRLIKVWDRRLLRGGQDDERAQPAGVLPGHLEGVTHIAPMGDDVHLISNAKDQTCKLWDVRMMLSAGDFAQTRQPRVSHWDYRWEQFPFWGQPRTHPNDRSVLTFRGHKVLRTLIRCYFSPMHTTGQRYVYSGSADGRVFIWDALTGLEVARIDAHRECVRDVSWHPTKPLLCSASWDGTVASWEPGRLSGSVGGGVGAGVAGAEMED